MKHDCCCPPANATACGCCEGVEAITPVSTANRPGLPALSYRIGTHATFLKRMKARLSSSDYPKLAGLTTRDADDPSIALLDAWATVADVVTFYQERIANEGYLRTATERRSILELARLVGYQPRPGVASSVYLAYTLDDNFNGETTIPKGARSQSIPGPGELPQSFETSEDLKARAKWNNLKPRLTQPQTIDSINVGDGKNQRIYLKGIATNLKPNDPLLIDFGSGTPEFYRVKDVKLDAQADRTAVILQKTIPQGSNQFLPQSVDLIDALTLPPSVQLANSLKLGRNLKAMFGGNQTQLSNGHNPSDLLREMLTGGEASHATLKAFAPVLRETLATAAENARVTERNAIRIYALRLKASLFGHNAPKEPQYEPVFIDNDRRNPKAGNLIPQKNWPEWDVADDERKNNLFLDRRYEEILPQSYLVVLTLGKTPRVFSDISVQYLSRNAYGISGETTKITINQEWWSPTPKEKIDKELRTTSVYAQSEELELAEEPISKIVCGGMGDPLELDGLYEGLESGRWVIVSGERDLPGTSGVRFSELTMLASVTQKVQSRQGILNEGPVSTPLLGDSTHTFITLATELKYCFKRDTVRIYGNVVKATHGETRKEVLGSGNGAKALQAFVLKQPPLTFVSTPNPSGVDSTLKVYVNDVQWKESDALAGLAPTDRMFMTKTDDEGKTTVIFGNGREGARLPTGIENIKAEYRNGIGKPGNVKAGQITLLTTRPLGVKEVINPLRASGGADKEGRDLARKNASLAVKALDRLVSVQDYEDFARVYAGIGKAYAVETSDGSRQLVHVTIAGADDIPIDANSDLYRNLRQSMLDFGDPNQAILLEIRELMLIVISAKIRILPEYQWEPVVTQVRTSLLEAFSFEHRELGQDVLLSEVMSVMQAVRGVAYVDVDVFGGIPEKKVKETAEEGKQRLLLTPQEVASEVANMAQAFSGNAKTERLPQSRLKVNLAEFEKETGKIRPAQIALLTPDVPDTLVLNQIT